MAVARSDRTGPLADLRIVELGGIGPVPFACMMLADAGASIVRFDRPDGGGPVVGGQIGQIDNRDASSHGPFDDCPARRIGLEGDEKVRHGFGLRHELSQGSDLP